MVTNAQEQQLQQELQNELTTSNQILRLISTELHKINKFTRADGDFDANIKQNVKLIEKLANLQQIDLENLPPVKRIQIDPSSNINQNLTYKEHDSFRNSRKDDSQ